MKTKISDELIARCIGVDDSIKSCDECTYDEQACLEWLLELLSNK